MSHAVERKEKDCLNCGTIVQGRFCQNCGQENIVPHETFGHMVRHFVFDILHFDGMFFDTVRYLILRPGFLSKEYTRGRRASYVNPVKMYIFTSFVFFLIFFSLFSISDPAIKKIDHADNVNEFIKENKENILSNTTSPVDSMAAGKILDLITEDTPAKGKKAKKQSASFGFTFDEDISKYGSVSEYDSLQSLLPAEKRDDWFTRLISRKAISLNTKYEGEETRISFVILNKFIHSFPYMLFVSLPLFALYLTIMHRRSKRFYFVDHGIFLIHLYIFTFIVLLAYFGIGALGDALGWDWLAFVQAGLILYGIWYAYRGMLNFYEQGRGKTLVKFVLFNFICFITILIIFMLFLLATFFRV